MKQTIVMLIVLSGVIYFVAHGGNFRDTTPAGQLKDARTQGQASVRIKVLYSDEKQDWIEEAHNLFSKQHPDLQVELIRKGSVEGAHEILNSHELPTVWLPADMMVVEYLAHLWYEKYSIELFDRVGMNKPVTLVRSPLVWLVWGDVKQNLLEMNVERPWVEIPCAGIPLHTRTAPPMQVDAGIDVTKHAEARPATADSTVTSEATRAALTFRHTDPSWSNSGLLAIYMMLYEYMGLPQEAIEVAHVDDEFAQWFQSCEARIPEFPRSTRGLSATMLRFGPGHFDAVVTYEQVALQLLQKTKLRDEKNPPRIFYPKHTLWSDHPAVILRPQDLPVEERDAARKWISFLASPQMQTLALRYALRPRHPDVDLQGEPGSPTPFTELARFDVQLNFESHVPNGSGAVAQKLMHLWRKATNH